ncbi:MAG: aminopeptidase [Gudongella sp.]|nr:aminopeptidase [Gudongella sp.]
MENFDKKLIEYAKLIIEIGINLQKGQPLLIRAPIEGANFVRILAKEAYNNGASDVHISWSDDYLTRLKFDNAPMNVFEEFPKWKADSEEYYALKGAAFVSIKASDPHLLKGVNPNKISTFNKVAAIATKHIMKYTMNNLNSWCVVAIPTIGWAKTIFPELSDEMAVTKLWDAIFTATRMDLDDPQAAWKDHINELKKRISFLNQHKFKKLYYTASNGTHLIVELPKGHIWTSGGGKNVKGDYFVANMPTEEVFTLPDKYGVNGIVYSSKPLNRSGNLIEDFKLVFKDGAVVEFEAKKGEEFLKEIFDMDDGAKRLGEVALVPFSSPIEKAGILFYNTLFDENASCHFAFGKAYPTTIEDGTKMNDEELDAHGVNDSLTHVDFMVGTSDMMILGESDSGEKTLIIKNGEWVI